MWGWQQEKGNWDRRSLLTFYHLQPWIESMILFLFEASSPLPRSLRHYCFLRCLPQLLLAPSSRGSMYRPQSSHELQDKTRCNLEVSPGSEIVLNLLKSYLWLKFAKRGDPTDHFNFFDILCTDLSDGVTSQGMDTWSAWNVTILLRTSSARDNIYFNMCGLQGRNNFR